eukprot:TRINITY_DN24883_c0_g1_i2.p1 TRINITY_DN24883_c0_g1~~TRINITY_DN24883_c0_g1_i2.p1  ORF type:complete len:366 (+),score=57.58 TRINITY_DN24883_c0_g1_i2:30-1100(+)
MDAGLSHAVEAVLVPSNEMPDDAIMVIGPSLKGDLGDVLESYHTTGFQATSFGAADAEINAMLEWVLADDQKALNTIRQYEDITDEDAKEVRTKVFLGVTSGLVLSGVRESITFLCRHKMVHVIVTPGGGIDNDILRALAPENVTVDEYNKDGTRGNIRVAEGSDKIVIDFVTNVLSKMVEEKDVWTPSEMTAKLGEHLPATSFLHWAAKNTIPTYSPSIVDGWVGEAVFHFNEGRRAAAQPPIKLDLIVDVKLMNCEATKAKHTGMIILGGGLVKHHICNANLMRNGADHSIFIGTGQEFDGSDAGARPDEAVSWGKIRPGTKPIKIYADASYVFPLLVARTFVGFYQRNKELYP